MLSTEFKDLQAICPPAPTPKALVGGSSEAKNEPLREAKMVNHFRSKDANPAYSATAGRREEGGGRGETEVESNHIMAQETHTDTRCFGMFTACSGVELFTLGGFLRMVSRQSS